MIASAYQVPWQPDGSDAEVVLASPGTNIAPGIIQNALAGAITASGGPQAAAITMADFTAPMVPPGVIPDITVSRMSYDPASGNFSASIIIEAADMAPQNLDLAGLAQASTPALVATHEIIPGEVIGAADVALARLPQAQAGNAITDAADAIGMTASTGIQAGAALSPDDLTTPIVIRKGGFVALNLSVPGMQLTAQGVALGDGGVGAIIPVLNPSSHAVVQAIVTGAGAATIPPGSTPLSTPRSFGGYGGYASYAEARADEYQPSSGMP